MRVYFDASQKGPDISFLAMGLLFVAIGGALLIFRNARFMADLWRGPKEWRTPFAVFFFGFACLWTLGATVGVVGDWTTTRQAEATGSMQIVEGPVEDFHPMPYSGHALETFTVQGVRFSYSDYEITSGFNQTSSHGGPIRSGMHVRIHYINGQTDRPTIVRLECPCDATATTALR